MRLNEEGDPMPLENLPRPHRRRREKKLMTMDEVNEKFPMMKYKNWVHERQKEGLPAEGGVSASVSRANSVRSVAGVIPAVVPEEPSRDRGTAEDSAEAAAAATTTATADNSQQPTDEKSAKRAEDEAQVNNAAATASAGQDVPGGDPAAAAPSSAPQNTPAPLQRVASADDDEDDEHINAALPPDMLGSSGDTCAICIDTLEDDDDVRGLTCGHAFHAVCVDPWLTSRRACCPLCKTDYYTPKPRPQGGEVDPNNPTAAMDPSRMNMPNAPPMAWYNLRGTRLGFGNRIGGFMPSDTRTLNARSHRRRVRQPPAGPAAEQTPADPAHVISEPTAETQSGPRPWNLSYWRWNRGPRDGQGQAAEPEASGANVTPGQLEAGNQPNPAPTNEVVR